MAVDRTPDAAIALYSERQRQLSQAEADLVERCPNLRDYYPDEDRYQAVYARWLTERDALTTRREALALAVAREQRCYKRGLLTDDEFYSSIASLVKP